MAEEIRDPMIERGIEEGWITPASRTSLGPAQRFPRREPSPTFSTKTAGLLTPDTTLNGDS